LGIKKDVKLRLACQKDAQYNNTEKQMTMYMKEPSMGRK
jgi:hypothetical protein